MMSRFKDKKVAVLMGGLSGEREISLRSGRAVAEGLRRKGYHLIEIDVNSRLPEKLITEKVEVVFIALHGKYGEDGTIQGCLEMMQIPYTGSGLLSSAIAMDKILSKRLLQERGFLTPAFSYFEKDQFSTKDFVENFSISLPVVVKPSREGSTLGIKIVKNRPDLEEAILFALQFDSRVLIEEFIQGREVTAGVLNGESLPLIEVVPKSGFYDFHSKYTKGATEYLVPAPISSYLAQEIQTTTLEIYHELGCEGVARADFIIDEFEKSFFLEINTIPGMTETSLIPKAAAQNGISFDDLVEKILDSARLKNK